MIYVKVFWPVIAFLLVLYYFMCVLQLFGIIRITKKEMTFPKVFIPFYYFFV